MSLLNLIKVLFYTDRLPLVYRLYCCIPIQYTPIHHPLFIYCGNRCNSLILCIHRSWLLYVFISTVILYNLSCRFAVPVGNRDLFGRIQTKMTGFGSYSWFVSDHVSCMGTCSNFLSSEVLYCTVNTGRADPSQAYHQILTTVQPWSILKPFYHTVLLYNHMNPYNQ